MESRLAVRRALFAFNAGRCVVSIGLRPGCFPGATIWGCCRCGRCPEGRIILINVAVVVIDRLVIRFRIPFTISFRSGRVWGPGCRRLRVRLLVVGLLNAVRVGDVAVYGGIIISPSGRLSGWLSVSVLNRRSRVRCCTLGTGFSLRIVGCLVCKWSMAIDRSG